MKDFAYLRARTIEDVVQTSLKNHNSLLIAGGTNLVDRLKAFLDQPDLLIDISHLDLKDITSMPNGGLRIGAMVTNTAVANHPQIKNDYPLLSRAILAGASQQIRNVATVGGNLLQRTRCPYYYDPAFACNKRQPESGCDAINGINKGHAIFGASDQCIAVHPSDMCVALATLDAVVEVEGANGQRQIPFSDFHRLPDRTPQQDTNLEKGELITAIILPPTRWAKTGVYLKLCDRASYSFALISVAVALEVKDQQIHHARIALGAVAHKPWRSLEAETFLQGKSATANIFEEAAHLALQKAKPLAHNQFKVNMAKKAIKRALMISAQGGGIA
jgi:xanthine dehydrogenase YagS FAD-binding subunit